MSFLRHREIYRSDGLGFRESGARSGGLHAPTHRFDEFPAGYSLAGCAPAEPASASPAEQKFTMKAIPRPSFFQRMGKPCLAGCLTSGVHRDSLTLLGRGFSLGFASEIWDVTSFSPPLKSTRLGPVMKQEKCVCGRSS